VTGAFGYWVAFQGERVVGGRAAGHTFLVRVKEAIEDPERLLIGV